MITAQQLKDRFPGAFDDLENDLLEDIIDEAELNINEATWGTEDFYNLGLYYLSAHIAATTLTTPGGGGALSGPITKRRVGDVEITFATPSATLSEIDLGTTSYGLRFLQYRRWVQGGPIVPSL